MTVTSFFPHLPDALLPARPHLVQAPRPRAAAARAVQRRRRIRLARTLARVSVRSALLPRCAARSRQRLRVCGSADILTALDVRVRVVGAAVPWPRLGRVVVSDHTGWLGDLALTTVAPGTPVIGRSSTRAPPGRLGRLPRRPPSSGTGRRTATWSGGRSRGRSRRSRPRGTW